MNRRSLLLHSVMLVVAPAIAADATVRNVRFGILKPVDEDKWELDVEARRIPMKLKDSGFRFGIAFENPSCQMIEWYEVVHLPAETSETTGNLRRDEPRTLKSDPQTSDQQFVVDDFWFDQGDPLGKHRMELFVNGQLAFSVSFEVVRA